MPNKKQRSDVKAFVLKTYRAIYKSKDTDAKILKTDPNGFDRDPAAFYERLSDRYAVENLRGTVAEIIDLILLRADDETMGRASKGSRSGQTSKGYGPYALIGRYLEDLPYAPNANDNALATALLPFKRIEKEYRRMTKNGGKAFAPFAPELQLLRQQAKGALEQGHGERIAKEARRRKVEDIDTEVVERILKYLAKAR